MGLVARLYAGAVAITAWFAIIGRYVSADIDSLTGTINFLSFFTILSNSFVATTLASAAMAPQSAMGRYLNRPAVATAAALYITVTGLVYHFLLSGLMQLTGWSLTFDQLLHYVMPPAYILFWLAAVPKGTLRFGHVVWMLVPPFLYAAYTLIRGPFAGYYPYPFIDAAVLGYLRTFSNLTALLVLFLLLGMIYLFIDRALGRLQAKPA